MKAADIAAIPDKRYGACADLPLAEAAANCRWLSGHCDGAHSRDGAGWSRFDKEAGTALATKLDAEWSTDDCDQGAAPEPQVSPATGGAPGRLEAMNVADGGDSGKADAG